MQFFDSPFNDNNSVEAGNFLLAEPLLDDPNFDRTVILVCQHSEEGSFGLVVNRQTEISVSEATDLLEIENKLFVGGPVEQNTMHFLHTMTELKESLIISEDIFWGGDFDNLQELALKGKITKQNCRFFVGYSGWSELQLDAELENNTWIISKVNPKIMFQHEPEQLWNAILQEMGGKYKIYSNYPTDPRLN
ncbi:YqgE/AlgH family protein [Bernardetia sp. ABR2-2B]|uniref:YqgE/AlgH family protein n=1 Tax=Bernardetia sp. ABR2-2B TaxID=3127472 RepID=UPI0030CECBA2